MTTAPDVLLVKSQSTDEPGWLSVSIERLTKGNEEDEWSEWESVAQDQIMTPDGLKSLVEKFGIPVCQTEE